MVSRSGFRFVAWAANQVLPVPFSVLAPPRMLDVEGAEAGGHPASTVVDLAGERPEVLRWDGLPERVLAPVLAEIGAP